MLFDNSKHQKTVLFIGPFPPPVHGQSLATDRLHKALTARGLDIAPLDTTGSGKGGAGALARLLRQLAGCGAILKGSGPVYISVNANRGMWLTAFLAFMARLRNRPLFLHHHTYDHIRRRRASMVWLARLAGTGAIHIVLAKAMENSLAKHTPEAKKVFVLNNAGLVDSNLLDLPEKRQNEIVLGHLSNLSAEKGIIEVVELAIAARKVGLPVRLVVAGPLSDLTASKAIETAREALGSYFAYYGPIDRAQKSGFFSEITCFVFPTRYRNEAAPLVLFEALASATPCIATRRACIPDALGKQGGVVISEDLDFVQEALKHVSALFNTLPQASIGARLRYKALVQEHTDQLDMLAESLRSKLS